MEPRFANFPIKTPSFILRDSTLPIFALGGAILLILSFTEFYFPHLQHARTACTYITKLPLDPGPVLVNSSFTLSLYRRA